MKPNASLKQVLTRKSNTSNLVKDLQGQLETSSDSPYLDALQLLSHITKLTRSQLLAHPDPQLTDQQTELLHQALQKLAAGTPLPYVLGEWEFYHLTFQITPEVLIPRPETEGLVERALQWLENHPTRRSCLELGTGCGCIAITLARSIPDLQLTATDISNAALKIARQNALRHGVTEQIQFLERDLLTGINEKADLLVANLPYIPTDKLVDLDVFQTEPSLALDGGSDGLRYIKKVLHDAQGYIKPGGAILLEIDEDTGAAALALAHDVWPGITLKLDQDLAGQDRYLSIQCP
jgi:release factor glutamine methyltransferase